MVDGIGKLHREMIDGLADLQSGLLRRVAETMADAEDREAMLAIEGARDWRDLSADTKENRYASARS